MAIDPKRTDVGRRVLYCPYVGAAPEPGVITSFNDAYVFVRYDGDAFSKATDRADLEWAFARNS